MPNLDFDKKPMQRAPYVSNEVPIVPSYGQDKKQDSIDDTFEGIKTPSKEKCKREKASSKPYLSISGDKRSIQHAPYVAKEQDTFDVITTPSVANRVKRMKSKFEGKDENICADAASPINLAASFRKPSLSNSDKKSVQRVSYATNEVPTVSSQDEKQDAFDVTTTSFKEIPKKENSEFEAKGEDICADTKYVSRLIRRFEADRPN